MINQSELDELIEYYPVLLDLPGRLRRILQSEARPFKLSAGRVLFEAGSRCTEHLMVLNGSIRVVKPASHEHEIVLYHVEPGAVCILTVSCLLENVSYTGRGVIESDLSAVMIPRTFFLDMLDTSQSFRLHIFHNFTTRLFHLMELVEEIAFGKLDQRLAAALLARGTLVQITHQLLADELHSSREAISRILEGWQEQGLVSLERGRIYILDKTALKSIAGLIDL